MTRPPLSARLRELAAHKTPGEWEWQTGSSWTRLGTNGRSGTRDGNVICPFVNQYDRHPDLSVKNCDADLIVTLANNVDAIVRALEAIEGAEKALEKLSKMVLVGADEYERVKARAANDKLPGKPAMQVFVVFEQYEEAMEAARATLATLRAAKEGA